VTQAEVERLPAIRRAPSQKIRRDGYWFLWPGVGILILLTLFPFLFSVVLSFSTVSLTSGLNIQFGTLANWAQLVGDSEFWTSMGNTALFVLLAIAIEFVLGFVLALLLMRGEIWGRRFFRTLFLVPMTLTPVAIAFMFRTIYNPLYGPVDALLRLVHLGQPDWLGDPHLALLAVVGVDIWEWTPFMFLLLLAAMQGIPREVMDAALVDGAGWWQQIWRITLPYVRPVAVAAVILRAIEAFKVFGRIYVMTGGGPGISTQSATLYAFYAGTTEFNLAYAATIALALMVVLVIVVSLAVTVAPRETRV
jgi:multiple sugar transport system permease protein